MDAQREHCCTVALTNFRVCPAFVEFSSEHLDECDPRRAQGALRVRCLMQGATDTTLSAVNGGHRKGELSASRRRVARLGCET